LVSAATRFKAPSVSIVHQFGPFGGQPCIPSAGGRPVSVSAALFGVEPRKQAPPAEVTLITFSSPDRPIPVAVVDDCSGAKPEAADFDMRFR